MAILCSEVHWSIRHISLGDIQKMRFLAVEKKCGGGVGGMGGK